MTDMYLIVNNICIDIYYIYHVVSFIVRSISNLFELFPLLGSVDIKAVASVG